MDFQKYQVDLLNKIESRHAISERVKEVFLSTPRHQFVDSFSIDGDRWVKWKDDPEKFLPLIYHDGTLLLYEDQHQTCTISQPSLVLWMLELLDVRPKDKIIELGAGSGWNAAMLGKLASPDGIVVSIEIIHTMAKFAAINIKRSGLLNVEIIHGDGSAGFIPESPYDKGIFTAGAYDIPDAFFDQIKDGGRLLFVLKTPSSGDILLLLHKINGHFEEVNRLNVRFVPVTGSLAPKMRDALDDIPFGEKLKIYRKREHPKNFSWSKSIEGHNSRFYF